MTEIYIMNTQPLSSSEVFSVNLKKLSEFRQKKVMSFRNKSDRALSLGAGLLIRYGLSRLGIDEKEMKYSLNEYGKPYFEEYPKIHFSVTHCGELAMCAFSGFNVGCDMELVKAPDYNVAKKFFSEAENDYIFGFNDESGRAGAFFRIWTRKESYVKAVGCGLSMPFGEFSVLPNENVYISDTKTYFFKEYVLGNYVSVCCCENDSFSDRPELVLI